MANTYLGNKGYSIYKDSISIKEQNYIRKELTVKPYVPKSSINSAVEFPVYRESNDKLYIPRFFGESLYGKPNKIKIHSGQDISLNFTGNLMEFQKPIIESYLNKAHSVGGGLLEVGCGCGKTVMALYIISMLKKKTLVMVHKEFLLEQWVERINQFLPGAKIGRIQGQLIDTDEKDIVIGMIQSLSKKTYPKSIIDQFGFTIIDETHHIAAEVFSNSLFQIVTTYMLGLSATMVRKDGLSKVFKMFIGEVASKYKRESTDCVLVKAMHYSVDDAEFNDTVLNYNGTPNYAIMIKKICEYNPRTEFILSILKNVVADKLNEQIMILAHNKNLLSYIYNAINNRNIGSVGYYIGGMKQTDLKISESKKIILATYAMAEEALDIKTLTTLIMATPKTDVTQAVGRILREKHEKPMVIDIIDGHNLFKKQWLKRQSFYKKNKYNIEHNNEQKEEKEEKEKILKGKCHINLEC
jgi:superfamily II DNA or RNA helicase